LKIVTRNLRSFSAPTERWSFMLQADWHGKLLIGGMHIWLHILIETILLGRNSEVTSVHITFLQEW
jgi:hypothetical protein